MQTPTANVTIEGRTTENTTSQHGSEGCEETMHVTVDSEDVYVPYDAVNPAAYDYYGTVPDELEVDRILVVDGVIHAEADVDGGVVELVPDYNTGTGEFRGYDAWEFQQFDDDTVQEGTVVHERGDA